MVALEHMNPATHAMTPKIEQLKKLYGRASEPHNAPDTGRPHDAFATSQGLRPGELPWDTPRD